MENLPRKLTVVAERSGSHLQGIAIDSKREYIYCSFTTCLLKVDMQGNIVGSVDGLVGHMGCIAYNPLDGRLYGSLEFKHDAIGAPILKRIGYTEEVLDGFYAVRFDVDKIDRMHMNAEKDRVMEAVFLKEVYEDFTASGHRYGCSGIDGMTFAPPFGEEGSADQLYIAYGIYEDNSREDNDHQVLLHYDISQWDAFAAPLDQKQMHRRGPEKPEGKYFVFTGNTRYGIQNLEYDPATRMMIAAVYKGKKPQYPNPPMFFIDCTQKPAESQLQGVGERALTVPLAGDSRFPFGATGIANLGNGYFYIAKEFREGERFGGDICLYRFDREAIDFAEAL